MTVATPATEATFTSSSSFPHSSFTTSTSSFPSSYNDDSKYDAKTSQKPAASEDEDDDDVILTIEQQRQPLIMTATSSSSSSNNNKDTAISIVVVEDVDTTSNNTNNYNEKQREQQQRNVTFRERLSFDRTPSYYSEEMPMNPWESTYSSKRQMLRQLTSFFFVLVITVGIPLTLYFTTRNHIEAIHSLLICAVLPLLYTIHVLIRHRRLDVFSFLLMLDYVIAGLVSLATGDATITTLRDSAATAVVSLVFYATMIPLRIRVPRRLRKKEEEENKEDTWFTNIRPLTFILSTEMLIDPHAKYRWINAKGMRQEMSVVDWIWSVRKVRIYHYWLTGGWATCLLVDYIIRVIMVLGTNVSVHMVYLSGSIIVMIELVIMTALGVIVAVLTRRVTRDWVRDNDYTEKYGWKVEQLRPSSEDSDSNGQEEEYDDPHHDV